MFGELSFLKELAFFLSSKSLVFFWCIFTILWALFLRFRIFSHLQRVRNDIASTLTFFIDQEEGSWIDKLKRLGEKIRLVPSFFLPWVAFQEKLAQCFQKITSQNLPGQTESISEDRVLLRTPLVEDYFNCTSLLKNKGSSFHLSRSPNFFNRLGVLGSFVVLISGVYLIQEGLQSGVLNSTQFALAELLSLISLALCSWITGLLVSLCFAAWFRREYKKLEEDITRWNRQLKELIPPASEDRWQVLQVTENQRQTEYLIDIKQSLKESYKFFRQQNLDFMKTFLTELRREVISNSQNDFSPLTSNLESFHLHTKKSCELMQETQKFLNEGSAHIRNQFDNSIEVMSKHTLLLDSHFENLSDLLATMKKFSADFFEGQEKQKDHLAQFFKVSQGMELSIGKIEKVHKNTCDDLKAHHERTIEVDKKLDLVFQKSHKNLEVYALKLNQYTSTIDRHTAKGLRFFAQAIGSLNVLLKGIPKASALVLQEAGRSKKTVKKKSLVMDKS